MAKKEVNVELNMTPFIGLFALLVVMLLLTAVWNPIAMLSTDTTQSSAASDDDPPPDKKNITFNVTILPEYVEMAINEQGTKVPHIAGKPDTMGMVTVLQQWKQQYPNRSDIVLNTENSVTYNQLVVVFDTLVGNDWPDVGVSTQ